MYCPAKDLITAVTEGRQTADGCPLAATMFTMLRNTDCKAVRDLWRAGYEIADHTLDHKRVRRAAVAVMWLRPAECLQIQETLRHCWWRALRHQTGWAPRLPMPCAAGGAGPQLRGERGGGGAQAAGGVRRA